MYRISLILVLFVSVVSAQDKTLDISVLVDQRIDKSNHTQEEFMKEIRNVISNDYEIKLNYILENGFNLKEAKENYQYLEQQNQDVIIVFGVVNNLMIYQTNPNFHTPTIVFGSVNSDFVPIDSRTTSEIHNLNYLITPVSFRADLNEFFELYEYKRIAILIDAYKLDILPINDLIQSIMIDLGAHYEIVPVDENFVAEGDLSSYDAIYLGAGNGLPDEDHLELIKKVNSYNVPSFSAFGKRDVELGIMASNQSESNIKQIYRRIALNIEKIFENGEDPGDLNVHIDYTKGLSINFNTAEKVGLGIKYNLISETDFVGDFNIINSDNNYTLTDVVSLTLENNLGLKAAEQSVLISGQDLKTAWSNYFPNLVVGATGSYVDPNLVSAVPGFYQEYSVSGLVQLDQTVYSQDLTALIKINKLLKQAEQANFNTSTLDAVKDITNVYFNCLVLKTNVIIQAKNLDVTRENLKIATQNFEAGYQGKTDLLRFTSEKAQNTQVLVESRNQLYQSYNLMNQILNQDISTKIDIQDVSLEDESFEKYHYNSFIEILNQPNMQPIFTKFLVSEGLKNAPELKSIGFNEEALDKQISLNGIGRVVPTLGLQAQYNDNIEQWGQGSDLAVLPNNYNVGLNLSIPIFGQNRRNIDRKTAMIQKDQINFDKENFELDLERRINDAVLTMVNEIVNIELSKVSEESAQEGLELTQTSYTEGAVNIAQLIDAQRNYLEAQLSRASAIYNYLIATLNMEREIGYFFLLHSPEENQAFFDRFNQFILENN